MPEIIVYATAADADNIRQWINSDPAIAWIVKVAQSGKTYRWQAVRNIRQLDEGSYSLWHTGAGGVTVWSANSPGIPVLDPFQGWTQTLKDDSAETPVFGGLVGPATFTWRESGRERPDSLARSGFYWVANRYAAIGEPAHPIAVRWWNKLKRFIIRSAIRMPWPQGQSDRKLSAFAFPDAFMQFKSGRHFDTNPWIVARAT